MYFVPHFGHRKVYETSIWTPCFQILAKTMYGANNLLSNHRGLYYYYLSLRESGCSVSEGSRQTQPIPTASRASQDIATPGQEETVVLQLLNGLLPVFWSPVKHQLNRHLESIICAAGDRAVIEIVHRNQ